MKLSVISPILYRLATYINDDYCILNINSAVFEVPMHLAISLCKKIQQIYLTDHSCRKFSFICELINQSSLDLLSVLFKNGTLNLEIDDDTCYDLYSIGDTLGIDELTIPYLDNFSGDKLNLKNVFQFCELHKKVSFPQKEMNLIIENFSKFEIPTLARFYEKNIDLLEYSLKSEALKLNDEDQIANLLICLSKRSLEFLRLFNYVYLDFCSNETFSNYVNFIETLIDEPRLKTAFSCITKAIDKKLETSLVPKSIYVNSLVYSHNVKYSSSSTGSLSDPVESLADSKNSNFFTANIPNSWITADLKEGSIIPTSYRIKSRDQSKLNVMQSWKLEGKTADGKLITLDEQKNNPINAKETKEFKLETKEKFIGFVITQIDANTSGKNFMFINEFDFSGEIYKL
ncbi:hypothetical protein TVAG_367520 [Trichomonas vaginalis G3]|uniref:BACK domain-containing protein n=1 Tax=Trichomonas vaginalis (strain ATCC PRA-98 / G3) TaxID=412133 RepID=A2F5Q9_TRIV3|nr:protein ubiquitination [Trichomonas vaginalis G3]EAX99759.1 hypothetical protein TVAG_367520 [Trichomonas vaginalis G3]KAI5489043.1 protein ubiquitination [Trichomonas vaginalis G3]|eukprot:XP_001312689.1 hypothetical protein [Trichomonas vaginalis G3]